MKDTTIADVSDAVVITDPEEKHDSDESTASSPYLQRFAIKRFLRPRSRSSRLAANPFRRCFRAPIRRVPPRCARAVT